MEQWKEIDASMASMLVKLSLETAESKHMLALFRRSASSGREEPECLGWMFSNIPQDLQGRSGSLSRAEKAIYLGLCVYAVCRQENAPNKSMVSSMVKAKIGREKLERIEMADSLEEMKMPLFQLTKYIVVSKGQRFDYVALTRDLYNMQFDKMKIVRKWERDYANAIREEKTNEK